eukprot:NODE_2273_length_491_cov_256.692308_g1851_i1.p2 GENE.NODE_2273_length_491_cov_256.692308_g1851_i1~~NODE_2273_length_491_cov_256.692308_g1851_i1.p2  ORF type:complete len:115 (+),score=25.06 NODE_2273_length_491_cov_256.692308_g1851_i1:32-346(+)
MGSEVAGELEDFTVLKWRSRSEAVGEAEQDLLMHRCRLHAVAEAMVEVQHVGVRVVALAAEAEVAALVSMRIMLMILGTTAPVESAAGARMHTSSAVDVVSLAT